MSTTRTGIRAGGLGSIVVGDVRVTSLPDGEGTVAVGHMMPAMEAAGWATHGEWLDNDDRYVCSVGGFLVESGDHRIVVDLGLGQREVVLPGAATARGGRLLESLRATGHTPADVDTVVYTHLHSDHSGWTSLPDGSLTFPNARHLIGSSAEWECWAAEPEHAWAPSRTRVLDPLADRVETAGDGYSVAPGVTLVATPGHTPGHQSMVISSAGDRAMVMGDVLICPVQVAEPEWEVLFDMDQALARRTRDVLMAELEDSSTVVGCSHFPGTSFGRILRGTQGRVWSTPG